MASLHENSRVGTTVAAEVRGLLPFSTNYSSTSDPVKEQGKFKFEPPSGLAAYGDMKRALSSKVKSRKADLSSTGPFTRNKNRNLVDWASQKVLTGEIANCMGLAFVTAKKLRDRKINNVDIVRVLLKDSTVTLSSGAVIPHWFVVIGRSQGSTRCLQDIGLPGRWGEHAVVVDSWDRRVYAATAYDAMWAGLRKAAGKNDLTCELFCRV